MKTVMQIVIICLVSLGVVAVAYSFGQSSPSFTGFDGRRPPEFRAQNSTNNGAANLPVQEGETVGRPEGGRERGEHGRGAQPLSARSLFAFGQTLIPMALVIGIVTLVSASFKRRSSTLQKS